MARNWTLQFEPKAMDTGSPAVGASPSFLTTTLRPSVAFDAATDESAVLEGIIPSEHTGSGTLKLYLLYASSTTTAANVWRIDIAGEARSPDNTETADADSYATNETAVDATFSTTAYSLESTTITLANFKSGESPTAGDKFRVKITRDANHANDDLAADCHLLGAELYEEV